MKPCRLSAVGAAVAGSLVTLGAVLMFWNTTTMGQALLVACPGIAFTAMLLLGSGHVQERLQDWVGSRPGRIMLAPVGLWALYAIYAIGMDVGGMAGLFMMAAYLGAPFLLLSISSSLELAAILAMWLPVELGLLRRVLTNGAGPDLHYSFAQLVAIVAGITAFAIWNRTPGIGYRFEWDETVKRQGAVNFLMFAVIAIPVGLAIGFVEYDFAMSKLYSAPALFLGVFFFTALPEEFLFRGLIQNWIEKRIGKGAVSLAIAAVIFGAAHLNNGPVAPNYRYFLMATIAGVFYGLAWRKTGSLMASAMTHALVNTFWGVAFR
jgi:membrane protease YdiL (CAAX protease family)